MNDRVSHQTSRKGWKPKKVSDRKLAGFIVESMKQNPNRAISFYGASDTVNQMVLDMLGELINAQAVQLGR